MDYCHYTLYFEIIAWPDKENLILKMNLILLTRQTITLSLEVERALGTKHWVFAGHVGRRVQSLMCLQIGTPHRGRSAGQQRQGLASRAAPLFAGSAAPNCGALLWGHPCWHVTVLLALTSLSESRWKSTLCRPVGEYLSISWYGAKRDLNFERSFVRSNWEILTEG